jgi:hypothetical protein
MERNNRGRTPIRMPFQCRRRREAQELGRELSRVGGRGSDLDGLLEETFDRLY